MATITYYESIVNAEYGNLNMHISVEIDSDNVIIGFKYNPNFYAKLTSESKTGRYDTAKKCWIVNKKESLYLLTKLKDIGAVCDRSIES